MTEPSFLLDTNICIYVLADAESSAAKRLGNCAQGSAVTSVVTYAELLRGVVSAGPGEEAKLARFFDRIPVLPFGTREAEAYARLPFRRGAFDRLIAAHALALRLTLVTNNERDFADVPDLRTENWTL
ncbi:MAG TPA: type II toxin-antitoxin system VapC family toxin [Microvirga sp.]|nr:type II toxin-antitoxin system VapC family toxin [Microvirga sp.]